MFKLELIILRAIYFSLSVASHIVILAEFSIVI